MGDTFYITTSIAYTNAKPHIGFAMELVQADALARFQRLQGKEVFFLTGTDEHGSKLDQAAKEQGITPQALVDTNSAFFRALKDQLNISADHFIRTTDENHMQGAKKMWQKMMATGDIYKDSYEGLYCVGCEAFILEKDLVEGKCPNHNKPPEKLKEENYFFKLSKYTEKIKQAIETGELVILPEARKNEILQVIRDGLKDVSFSRPKTVLTWGIEVPDDPEQVMYVWCDALSNYITGIGYSEDAALFRKFWPANVHLIGKDILRFHSAIWIGMLMSAELPLPKAVYVHGFITSEGKKMSKSLNNVVDPVEYIEKYGADALRYYLLKEVPTAEDGDFSKEHFQGVYASDLANNIGNLVSRVLAMTHKYFEGKIPQAAPMNEIFDPKVKQLYARYEEGMGTFDLKKALEEVASFANYANKYVEDTKPWVLAKNDPAELANVMYALLEMVRHLALLLTPFMPATSDKILGYLGYDIQLFPKEAYNMLKTWGVLKPGQSVQKVEPLFARIETV